MSPSDPSSNSETPCLSILLRLVNSSQRSSKPSATLEEPQVDQGERWLCPPATLYRVPYAARSPEPFPSDNSGTGLRARGEISLLELADRCGLVFLE